jgi:hypothetical protein
MNRAIFKGNSLEPSIHGHHKAEIVYIHFTETFYSLKSLDICVFVIIIQICSY